MARLSFAHEFVQTEPWPIPRHVHIIAEIGINHNGDLSIAKKLIDLAKAADCDSVKFQKRTIDIVYSPELLDSPRESPWGATVRQQKQGLEFGESDYDEIDRYCREVGIHWFASAWDTASQKFLRKYDCPYNKIASAMATHKEFLQLVASEQRPTFISTGMCNWEDIDAAVQIFKAADCPFVLMHTISEYPCGEELLNLQLIHHLRARYASPVGYSGHEPTVSPSIVAAAMGAVAIERHITLSRAMYGSDQAASLEEPGLVSLVRQIRKIPVIVGDGVKRLTLGEARVADKLRYWNPVD
jgi:N-acetylneuraminate synthase